MIYYRVSSSVSGPHFFLLLSPCEEEWLTGLHRDVTDSYHIIGRVWLQLLWTKVVQPAIRWKGANHFSQHCNSECKFRIKLEFPRIEKLACVETAKANREKVDNFHC